MKEVFDNTADIVGRSMSYHSNLIFFLGEFGFRLTFNELVQFADIALDGQSEVLQTGLQKKIIRKWFFVGLIFTSDWPKIFN